MKKHRAQLVDEYDIQNPSNQWSSDSDNRTKAGNANWSHGLGEFIIDSAKSMAHFKY